MNKKSRNILGILSVLLFPLGYIYRSSEPYICGSAPFALWCLWVVFTGISIIVPLLMTTSNLVSMMFKRDLRSFLWVVYPVVIIATSMHYHTELYIAREIYTYKAKHEELEAIIQQIDDPCGNRIRTFHLPPHLKGVSRDGEGHFYWHEDNDNTCSYGVIFFRTDFVQLRYYSDDRLERASNCFYKFDSHWYVC